MRRIRQNKSTCLFMICWSTHRKRQAECRNPIHLFISRPIRRPVTNRLDNFLNCPNAMHGKIQGPAVQRPGIEPTPLPGLQGNARNGPQPLSILSSVYLHRRRLSRCLKRHVIYAYTIIVPSQWLSVTERTSVGHSSRHFPPSVFVWVKVNQRLSVYRHTLYNIIPGMCK